MGMRIIPKIVLITRQTRLAGLQARFNTVRQARFYIENLGQNFDQYEEEADVYSGVVGSLRRELPQFDRPVHAIDRAHLTNYWFDDDDIIVTVGPDGLVVNTAKYLQGQPIVAVNPDPARIDGILLPFQIQNALVGVSSAVSGRATFHEITMAEVKLNDGQSLLAFNDFLIGHRSHVSARYRIELGTNGEEQSSSGVLISTGAGSTGWFSSMQNMARIISQFSNSITEVKHRSAPPKVPTIRLSWDDPRLLFVVREPFASRSSQINLAAGIIGPGEALTLESRMPEGGVIFSDGVEADALPFNAGTVATVRTSDRKTRLVRRE
jgi:NAD kinase